MHNNTVAQISDWSEANPPNIWGRYLARMLDTVVIGFSIGYQIIIYIGNADYKLYGYLEMTIGLYFLTALINTVVMSVTGTTLGKWVFGIRVLDSNLRSLSFNDLLKRELYVFVNGVGCGVPLINLACMLNWYVKLKNKSQTSWDEDLNIKLLYRANNPVQKILFAIGTCLTLLAILIKAALTFFLCFFLPMLGEYYLFYINHEDLPPSVIELWLSLTAGIGHFLGF
jgi:uncharacterized RDD family membrane protein YckC